MLSLTQYKKKVHEQFHLERQDVAEEVKINQDEASIQNLAKRVNLQSEFF